MSGNPKKKEKKTRDRSESSDTEILSGEGLTELPMRGCHVPWGGCTAITARDPDGKNLANENGVGLPVLTPVAAHAHPPSARSFNAHPHDVSCTRNVGNQNQIKETEAVDRESDASLLSAWNPAQKILNSIKILSG